jgi:polar amino acid transport system permease protein
MEIYLVLGITYFVLCFGLSRFAYSLDRQLQRQGGGPVFVPPGIQPGR